MFHAKSRTEQLQDQSASLADSAATVAEQLRERVVPAIGQAADTAREWGQPRVEAARDWAKPRVEHGIEIAAPRLESAVSGLAPKVDTARDKIVDELLPRVTEAITAWAAASAAAKDEAVSRGSGAAAVISGGAVAKPKRKKKGKFLLGLGLIGAAGAAAVAFMKKGAPKDDPWATPMADAYVAPSNGRHSSLTPVRDDTADAVKPTDAVSGVSLAEDNPVVTDVPRTAPSTDAATKSSAAGNSDAKHAGAKKADAKIATDKDATDKDATDHGDGA